MLNNSFTIFHQISGMSSLFSTLTFSVVRLMIIKRKNNVWLQNCEFSFKETRALQIIWLLSLSFSLPPFFGFGRYGKDVIGVRYYRFLYLNVESSIKFYNLYFNLNTILFQFFIFFE